MLLMLVILASYDIMLMIFGRVSIRKFIIIKRKKIALRIFAKKYRL